MAKVRKEEASVKSKPARVVDKDAALKRAWANYNRGHGVTDSELAVIAVEYARFRELFEIFEPNIKDVVSRELMRLEDMQSRRAMR